MISEERLSAAAKACGYHILSYLPEPSECKAAFSPRFERKMKKLFFKINHPIQYWMQRSIVVLLLIAFLVAMICIPLRRM